MIKTQVWLFDLIVSSTMLPLSNLSQTLFILSIWLWAIVIVVSFHLKFQNDSIYQPYMASFYNGATTYKQFDRRSLMSPALFPIYNLF